MKTLNRIFSFSQPFYCALGLLLLASAVQANEWIITDTVQNGSPGAFPGDPGAPTLGMVLWHTNGVNGGGSHAIYGQAVGPVYFCYGLLVIGPTTCADVPTPVIWDAQVATYTGTVNDDPNAPTLTLSWTGQAGSEVPLGPPFVLFASSILSGSYDVFGQPTAPDPMMAGYDTDGFSCFNNPLARLPGPPDFCGNATGLPTTTPTGGGQTIASRALTGGLVSVIDHMDGTITISMEDTTFTDCVADVACTPDSSSSDVFAQWTVNADLIGVVPPRDIPNVVGLEQTIAETDLTDEGLTVGTVAMTNDPNVLAGRVISQNPFACDDCAKLNDRVDLVVSLGPLNLLTVPEQLDELADDVRALALRPDLTHFLIETLEKASATLEYCDAEQSNRGNRGPNLGAGNCRREGERKAVQRLELFAKMVRLRSGGAIPEGDTEALIAGADTQALIEKSQAIIDDILRKPPSTGLYMFVSGGVERTYYLRVPENYSEFGDPQPIIFGFHGATDTYLTWFEGGFHGEGLQELVGDQAIMVFPQALESSAGITLWNSEVDLDFFADLLSRLQSQLLIDPNRIFATGHSAGGGFSHQLGCIFGDIIRAIAPSSGFLLERECTGSVAVLQMQSTEDQVANISLVQLTRDVWVAYNGYEQDIFSDGIVEPCIDYSLGTSLYPVQWCPHTSFGANGHQWWDEADEAIWAFFSSLPTAVPTTDAPPGGGNDRILDELPASLSFTVRYPADMNDLTLLTAVLYPAGTEQPIFNAPLWFLNGEIPFDSPAPGTEQTYENVPISLFASSPDMPLPGTYTLSIGAFVEGGSFPIPASGIDHIALIEVEIQDQFSPIIVNEILDLVPVEGF